MNLSRSASWGFPGSAGALGVGSGAGSASVSVPASASASAPTVPSASSGSSVPPSASSDSSAASDPSVASSSASALSAPAGAAVPSGGAERREWERERVRARAAAIFGDAGVAAEAGPPPPGHDPPGSRRGERMWCAVRERLPLWVQLRCGTDPKALAALVLVLVVVVGFAVQHFWAWPSRAGTGTGGRTGRSGTRPRLASTVTAVRVIDCHCGGEWPAGHCGATAGRRCHGQGPAPRNSADVTGVAGGRCPAGRGRCAARGEYPGAQPGAAADRR